MTPGIDMVKGAGIEYVIHEYVHDPATTSYGLEAAEKLGVPSDRVFKTLVVSLDGKKLAVAVVPVEAQLNLKKLARAAGAKKAAMADRAEVERATGYVLGGVSPLGQKKRLPTYVDSSATEFATIFVSAGRRGLEIELAPEALAQLVGAQFSVLSMPRSD